MKLHTTQLVYPIFLILPLLPLSHSDLNSDKHALLAFSNTVPHGPKLNWSNTTSICTSWVGINCTSDGTRVLTLRLPGVGLTGPIPPNTIGKLDALRVISLRSNRLNGNIPSDLLSLPSLRSLFLQHNNFTGNIPMLFPHRIHVLDLSFNSFSGHIPANIKNIKSLTGLYLQNNSISGHIPDGTFPRLKHINVSNNHLNGSIPSFFKTFPKSSFLGNLFSCGPPLSSCSSPKRKLSIWAILGISFGSVVVLVLVIMFVLWCVKKKPSHANRVQKGKSKSTERARREFNSGEQENDKNNKLVFFEGGFYNFDLEDLLRASAEVLGKGSFGTAYKAILEESTTVVVKRLKEVVVGKKEFELQMESIGRVGLHSNVVPLRAYYYSKDEKLLVYDYIPGGSLLTLLHGTGGGATKPPLDWETRVRIALTAARGLSHIHSTGGPNFTHGNIKSSNILITQTTNASISDTGLTPLTNSPPAASSSGYRAPELLNSPKPTHKSDVYSFGVLLLEMLTGKQPVQSPRRDDMVDLPRWVQSVVREEWTAEVFDLELMRFRNIEEEMVRVLQVGLACVVRVPHNRPDMGEVVRMLEEIPLSDSENRRSSDENRLST